jgi:pimeloyl-ACP methyl ester carboxylesterase
MTQRLTEVSAPDGRTLGVAQWGDPDGSAVFALHGIPGSRLVRPPDEEAIQRAGLRLVTYDRPGYGASHRQPGRRVVDCAQDVAAIADALGLDRFAVSGFCGGGPHALAVAACLDGRVTAAECQRGSAPFGAEGLDWWAGMSPEGVAEFGWALDGERALHENLMRLAEEKLAGMALDRANMHAARDAQAGAELARPDAVREFVNVMRDGFTAGIWGRVDDNLAVIAGWGFSLDEIAVPVTIRYGARDLEISPDHAAWLGAHIPDAKVVVDPDGGHFIDPDTRIEELRALVAAG